MGDHYYETQPSPKMSLGAGKPALGAGKKVGALPGPTPLRPVDPEGPALFVAAPAKGFTPPTAPADPGPAVFMAPSLGGVEADIPLLGGYPREFPTGDVAEQFYKLSGTSRDKAKNAYPYDQLQPGQRLYLVADPYGETVKLTKVSMPGDTVGHPDPTAISVVDAPVGGHHVGYIPAQSARALSFVFGEHPNTQVWVTVEAINRDKDGVARGVNIKAVFAEGATAC